MDDLLTEKKEELRGIGSEDQELVVRQFYDFFSLINELTLEIREKQKKESVETQDYEKGRQYLDTIRARVINLLRENYEQAHVLDWGHGRDYYRQAQYVMCVFADERFINIDWYGAVQWQRELLEMELFNTSNAGNLFFDQIDEIISKRSNLYIGLAKVYLLAVALGFKGKFRGVEDPSILDSYKKRLFLFIYGGKHDQKELSLPIFEEAYFYTPTKSKPKLLPMFSKSLMIGVILVIIYLLGSYVIWKTETSQVAGLIVELKSMQQAIH